MLKAQIKPGTEYAFREHHSERTPFHRVRVLQHTRGTKWRAEWIEPSAGLVDYVDSGQLVVPWKEHKAFLKEEANAESIRQHNQRLGYDENSPIARALYQVFESIGDDVSFYRGILRGSPEAVDRVKTRAAMDPTKRSPVAYIDRQGKLHLPFDEAFELARMFCGAEPGAVLVGVETTERDWARQARRPGEEYMVPLLNDYRASWALIRQWAGHDAAVAQRETEIQRLERLAWDAVYALQKAGLDKEAAKLRRTIEKDRSSVGRTIRRSMESECMDPRSSLVSVALVRVRKNHQC